MQYNNIIWSVLFPSMRLSNFIKNRNLFFHFCYLTNTKKHRTSNTEDRDGDKLRGARYNFQGKGCKES